MAKQTRKDNAFIGSPDSPAAQTTMEKFLAESGLAEHFSAGRMATLNIWNPAVDEIRAFVYTGQEEREGKGEFSEGTFVVHYGKDLKTGEEFSFIGGGLFSWVIENKKIAEGTALVARYLGIRPIDEGKRQAKHWEIRMLDKK